MGKRKKNVDSADLVVRLRAATWSLLGGFLGGLMMVWAAVLRGDVGGAKLVLWIAGGFVFGVLFAYFGSTLLTQRAAKTIGNVYAPSGSSTPAKRDYSKAKALTMKGDYESAAAAWELNCVEFPDDPVPYLELARLHRNQFKDYQEAVRWYHRAIEDSSIKAGQLLLATQEITEIYLHKLDQPRKAIPHLANFASRYPEDPHVDGVKNQLAELRELIRREDGLA